MVKADSSPQPVLASGGRKGGREPAPRREGDSSGRSYAAPRRRAERSAPIPVCSLPARALRRPSSRRGGRLPAVDCQRLRATCEFSGWWVL